MILSNIGRTRECPFGSGNGTDWDVSQWRTKSLTQISGSCDDQVIRCLRAAPITGIETSTTKGFFGSSSDYYVERVDINGLIADGWEVDEVQWHSQLT
jgi:hypothetical protein